jgi:1,2-phenylacetyl-CoA epoxidase PaaB subunit
MIESKGKNRDYDVFTRIKRGDDLTHIGTVEASTDELAKVYANYVYDEEKWVEMFVVRRENMVCVREVEGLFKAEVGINV